MQYLLKIQIQNTRAWRLLSVDGEYNLSKLMKIISLAFSSNGCAGTLLYKDKEYVIEHEAAVFGDEFSIFDSFDVQEQDIFSFTLKDFDGLAFLVTVLKKAEHLDCLLPSLIAGVGPVNSDSYTSYDALNDYLESDVELTLDCKEITKRIREFNIQKENINDAMIKAGAKELNFRIG